MGDREKVRIFLVDDDEEYYFITKRLFSKLNTDKIEYNVDWVSSYDEALSVIKLRKHDIYLIDYILKEKSGLDLLKEINQSKDGFSSPVIFLTGIRDKKLALEAMGNGASDYLYKEEVDSELLERSIYYAIERKKLETEIRHYKMLQELILEKTTAGICLFNDDEILVKSNRAFNEIFNIKGELDGKSYSELLTFYKYENEIYNPSLIKKELKLSDLTMQIRQPIEGRIKSFNGKTISCLLSCGKVLLFNGDKKIYTVLTIIDITKQKSAESKLAHFNVILQNTLENHGIANSNPMILADLVELELMKIQEM